MQLWRAVLAHHGTNNCASYLRVYMPFTAKSLTQSRVATFLILLALCFSPLAAQGEDALRQPPYFGKAPGQSGLRDCLKGPGERKIGHNFRSSFLRKTKVVTTRSSMSKTLLALSGKRNLESRLNLRQSPRGCCGLSDISRTKTILFLIWKFKICPRTCTGGKVTSRRQIM